MASQPSLTAATPRGAAYRHLVAGSTLDARSWAFGRWMIALAVLAHTPVAVAYLTQAAHAQWWLPAGAALAALASFAPGLPRRASATLLGAAVGLLPPLTYGLPHGEGAAAVIMVTLFIVIGLLRDWLPWAVAVLLTTGVMMGRAAVDVEGTFGPGHTHAVEDAASLAWHLALFAGASLLSLVVMLLVASVRAQAIAARTSLAETRRLLAIVADTSTGAGSLHDAAQQVLDTMCDERWPIGHLYLVRDGRFVNTDVWSARARSDYSRVVAHTDALVTGMTVGTYRLGHAAVLSRSAAWSSQSAGSDGVGPLDAPDVSPRAAVLSAAGIRTVTGSPIVVDGEVVAVIEIDGTDTFAEAPDELATVHLIATYLSDVATRERDRARLLERDELLGIVESTVPDAAVIYDVEDGQLLWLADRDGLLDLTEDDLGSPAAPGTPLVGLVSAVADGPGPISLALELPDRLIPVEVYQTLTVWQGRQVALLLVRDVSGRQEEQRALTRAFARSTTLIELAGTGIFELAGDGTVIFANAPGASMLRCDAESLVGSWLGAKIPFLAPLLGEVLAGEHDGTVVRCQGELERDGERVRLSAAFALVGEREAGEAPRVIATLTDVTDTERAARLDAQRAHAIEVNDTVVQGVSTALYAIESEDLDAAQAVLNQTLRDAKSTIAALNADTAFTADLLQRMQAASVPHRGSSS